LVDAPAPNPGDGTQASGAAGVPVTGAMAPIAALGPTPEPLARLGNYAVAGVCAVVAYWALFLVVTLLVVASGSIEGAVILNLLYLLFFLVVVAAGIPFIAWFYRAYRNLPLLEVKPRFSPGMAIACWLIPFANWVLPGIIGDEIWKAGRSPSRPPRADGLNLARVWWGVNVGVSLAVIPLLVALSFLFGSGEVTVVLWGLLTSAMVLASAGLAIAFVRRAGQRLDALGGHAPPEGDFDRAIASIYEALPVPASLTEEDMVTGVATDGGPVVPSPPVAGHVQSEDTTTTCVRCGAAEEAGANFCGACGSPLR
jgi:hypothetical protein